MGHRAAKMPFSRVTLRYLLRVVGKQMKPPPAFIDVIRSSTPLNFPVGIFAFSFPSSSPAAEGRVQLRLCFIFHSGCNLLDSRSRTCGPEIPTSQTRNRNKLELQGENNVTKGVLASMKLGAADIK